MIRWYEDGIERVLSIERIATWVFDATKDELRIKVWEREVWMPEEIVIRGKQARQLNDRYGITDATSLKVIRDQLEGGRNV